MADVILDARDAALRGLVDDASALPPLRRDPLEVLRAHLERLSDSRAWMAGRVVLPLREVEEVATQLDQLDLPAAEGEPVRPGLVVQLGRVAAGAVGATVTRDLEVAQPLLGDDRVVVEALDVVVAGRQPDQAVTEVRDAVDAAGVDPSAALYVEVSIGDRAPGEVVQLLEAIAAADDPDGRRVLARGRLLVGGGGVVSGDTDLSGFLLACAATRTATTLGPGLVGAVRRPRSGGGHDHGLLNVLGAAVLAYQGRRLAAVHGALTAPPETVRLGSGALILGEEVVESDALADVRTAMLTHVAAGDPSELQESLTDLGAVADDGSRA